MSVDDKPKTKSGSKLVSSIYQNRVYLIGIVMGLVLIVVNTYFGIYLLNLVQNNNQPSFVPGIALPKIDVDGYRLVKENLDRRTEKSVSDVKVLHDPFKTR